MGDHDTDIRGVYRKLSAPFWGFLVFSVLTISGLVFLATQGQDRNAINASVHLAHAAVAATERSLANLAYESAYWDQAVENLVTNIDPDWADENIGPYLNEAYGISSSHVLGTDNQLVYGSIEGERSADDPLARFSGGLDILIARVRSGSPSAPPKPATGLIHDPDSVYFAAAVALTTYFTKDGEEIDQATGSVLILTQTVDEVLLSELAENYLLYNLRVRPTQESISVASIPLIAANGEQIRNMSWEPELPGEQIVSVLISGIVGVFALMAATMFLFLRRAKEFSFQLAQKSELLKSTLDSIDQGIAAWDDQNQLLAWNAKCEDFWYHPTGVRVGMTKRELIGHIGHEGGFGLDASSEAAEKRYQELLEEGANSADEFRLHDGRHISLYRYPMPSGGHTTVYSDVTTQKVTENEMLHQATIDALTGLPNRVLLFDRIAQTIEHARREDRNFGLVFVDLDLFKQVNDTRGHAAGDQLLKQVGDRLQRLVRDEDTVSRLGGDEFIVLLHDVEMPSGSETVAMKIIEAFIAPFVLETGEINITASLGIAIFPDDGEEAEVLLQHSDAAMYKSKQLGRNTFQFFSSA